MKKLSVQIFLGLSICTTWLTHAAWALPIVEDEGYEGSGSVYPNEGHSHYFKDVLHQFQHGTLISVGTFRTFIDAGLGKFERVVLFDFEKGTTHFNRLHVRLLKALGQLPMSLQRQRYEYFAVLNCYWLNDEQLKLLETFDDPSSGISFSQKLLGVFDKFSRESPKECRPEKFPSAIATLVRELQKADLPGFKGPVSVDQGFLGIYYGLVSNRPSFYWENDRDWEKLQRLVNSDDRVLAVVGDLLGDRALKTLGSALSAKHEEVSVIDVSNAFEQWVFSCYAHPLPDATRNNEIFRNEYSRFWSNLKALPLAKDAVVLRTSRSKVKNAPHNGDWSYFWRRMSTYVSASSPHLADWCVDEE